MKYDKNNPSFGLRIGDYLKSNKKKETNPSEVK